jgi:CRISPR-associated protein Csx14
MMTTDQPAAAATLIATIGGQPQVVTFALDALLAQGEEIAEVYIVHLTWTIHAPGRR